MNVKPVKQFVNRLSQDRQLRGEVERSIEINPRQIVTKLEGKHDYKFAAENQLLNYSTVSEAQTASSQLSEEQLEIIAYYVWSFGI